MKKHNYSSYFPVSLLVLVLMATGCQLSAQNLRIAIMGDQTGTRNLDSAYVIMAAAAENMRTHSPDLVIHVGDLTESQVRDSSAYAEDFHTAADILTSVGVPWYPVAGDHDVNPPGFAPLSMDRSYEKRFRSLCRKVGLPIDQDLFYSVDVQDFHFIFLYSLENLHTDPRWGSIFLNGISDRQLEWLESDLNKHRDARGIIVVTHHPHWYSWSNWQRVHAVLRDHSVMAVIAGHFHYDQDDGSIDGIRYLVIGATGGSIKDADPESGGCHQYALMDISNRDILNIELHEAFSDTLLELTPRRSMDRVQALAVSLGNIYKDEKILLANRHLVKPDAHGEYSPLRTIGLESPANPIDLPIEMTISTIGEYLQPLGWVSGNGPGSGRRFNPGERIGWANYSSTGQWVTPPEIWQAKLIQDALPEDNAPLIGVRVKASFTDIRSRWVAATIMFPIEKIDTHSGQ
ncbi:MAG TPA: hypothetical protein EYO08_04545 [Candidatus Marinimicrobia bacterium]|nr:hypothetical protein [Candidatus Neomarinimicrobiota bacterium]